MPFVSHMATFSSYNALFPLKGDRKFVLCVNERLPADNQDQPAKGRGVTTQHYKSLSETNNGLIILASVLIAGQTLKCHSQEASSRQLPVSFFSNLELIPTLCTTPLPPLYSHTPHITVSYLHLCHYLCGESVLGALSHSVHYPRWCRYFQPDPSLSCSSFSPASACCFLAFFFSFFKERSSV